MSGLIDKTLVLDLKVSVADSRILRNIFHARDGKAGAGTSLVDQTLKLPISGSPTSYVLTGASGNTMTLVYADSPVQISITNANGTLNLGTNTMFMLTANLTTATLTNSLNTKDVEVHIIHI